MLDRSINHLAGGPSVLGKLNKFLAKQGVGSLVQRLLSLLAECRPLILSHAIRSRVGSAQASADCVQFFGQNLGGIRGAINFGGFRKGGLGGNLKGTFGRDCPRTVLGLSRDIGGFQPFPLIALAITVSGAPRIQARLQSLNFFNGKRDRFCGCASFAHASDEGGNAHTTILSRRYVARLASSGVSRTNWQACITVE